MNLIRKLSVKTCLCALLPAALMIAGNVAAKEETLECMLYIAESMDSDVQSSIAMKDAGLTLDSVRRSSVCVFDDGRVADKQFVMVSRVVGDGATGSTMGYSVYTMENGDSVSAEFTGNWGSNGYKGVYKILGGTGNFKGANGDGTITDTQSPWATTDVLKIVLKVKTP